jgi:hypothetical protein
MLSSKTINSGVIEMYEGKAFIKTVITLYSPVDENDPLYEGFKNISTIEPVLKGMNSNVEDVLMDTFESDIVSIHSSAKNFNLG